MRNNSLMTKNIDDWVVTHSNLEQRAEVRMQSQQSSLQSVTFFLVYPCETVKDTYVLSREYLKVSHCSLSKLSKTPNIQNYKLLSNQQKSRRADFHDCIYNSKSSFNIQQVGRTHVLLAAVATQSKEQNVVLPSPMCRIPSAE